MHDANLDTFAMSTHSIVTRCSFFFKNVSCEYDRLNVFLAQWIHEVSRFCLTEQPSNKSWLHTMWDGRSVTERVSRGIVYELARGVSKRVGAMSSCY